jgi:8-oxo-dGTP diphosphatase
MTEANLHISPESLQTKAIPLLQNLDVRVVIFSLHDDRLQVLLHPINGRLSSESEQAPWSLPGVPIPENQSLEGTATQCVLRLSGAREAYLDQLYTYGEVNRTAPENGSAATTTNKRVVSIVYSAIIPAGAVQNSISSDQDELTAQWFPVDHLPNLVMDHDEILAYALRRLRYKLEYTAIGFQLLPEQFSLSELQKVYEMILGEKLDKRNFRRRILQASIIEETNYLRSGEGRPARLYRYRPDAVAEIKARRLFP